MAHFTYLMAIKWTRLVSLLGDHYKYALDVDLKLLRSFWHKMPDTLMEAMPYAIRPEQIV
jgi:hypothetical protein